mmetsp:Transcript_11174/g.9555  ORF Transcript_11174/g.9555 Transcript_11174/m.9555 type:complete len:129 (-) Transcript_11174:534-920(-)
MRSYVGQWRHPDFYDQEDTKYTPDGDSYDAKEKSKLFYHKISKFEVESRARPFLKIKLIEPEYVEKYSKMLNEKRQEIHNILNTLNSSLFFNQNLIPADSEVASKKNSFVNTIGSKMKGALKAIIPTN